MREDARHRQGFLCPGTAAFVEIEGSQRAVVLAAQASTSLIPFLVIVAAFAGEGDMADKLVERFDLVGLAPGAAVIAALAALAGVASAIYVPILMTWSAERYGLIGIAISLQTWLVGMGFVIVAGAVVGAVVASGRATARLR